MSKYCQLQNANSIVSVFVIYTVADYRVTRFRFVTVNDWFLTDLLPTCSDCVAAVKSIC